MRWVEIAFLLTAGFILYTLFGYPLLLGLIARVRRRPIAMAPGRRTVSIVLPVRDGERWLRAKLESMAALDYPRELVEVLVISDGSADATDAIARGFPGVRLIRVPRAGKAAALNAGIRECRGEILFFTDVRQQLAPDSLAKLVACFADPAVGVASGELVIRDGNSLEEAHVGLYWRYEKWIRRRLSEIDSVPGATGCIYAMRRELAVPLPPDTLVDDMYLPLAAFFRGYRVVLVDARAFDAPTMLETEFRRKVRTLAGVYQVIGAYPRLLGPANRMWLHFVSHKLARLLLPWALLAAAALSFALPAPWRLPMLAAQAAFYGLASADALVPESRRLKRATSAARTFCVLMAASLCAVSIWFVESRALWGRPTGTRARAAAGR